MTQLPSEVASILFKYILLSESIVTESFSADFYFNYLLNVALPGLLSIDLKEGLLFILKALKVSFKFDIFGVNGSYVVLIIVMMFVLLKNKISFRDIYIPVMMIAGSAVFYILIIIYTTAYGYAAYQ